MARVVDSKLPDNHGFILLAFPFGESPDNRLIYTASCQRADAIKMLKEFLFALGESEAWMNHIR